MQNINTVVTVVGIVYGAVLILATFVRRIKFIELMRIDALVIPQPTESTRPVNLVAGLLIAGYGIYSLLAWWILATDGFGNKQLGVVTL